MLVLSRKVGQSIVIGNGIEITIVEMRGDQVRLGIDAPREVPINRKEVLDRARTSPPATSASEDVATATQEPILVVTAPGSDPPLAQANGAAYPHYNVPLPDASREGAGTGS